MIYDKLENRDTYCGMGVVYEALQYLATMQSPLQSKLELHGEALFINPVSLTSKPQEDCVFEAHRRYIDIHYILSGVEGIAVRDVAHLSPEDEFDEEKDVGFYCGQAHSTTYLHPGDFMICYPQDAHMVAIMDGAPSEIKKLVVKIMV